MYVQTRDQALSNLFEQILQSLTHSQESLLSAPTPWRAELERQLSLAIVDEEYRGVYQHVLLKFGNNHHRTMPPSIPIDQIPTNLILKSGLGVLDDESLAKLSLDLFAIEPLANRYENATEPGSLGEIWAEVFTWSTPEELAEEPAQTLNVYNKIKQILSEEDERKEIREISDFESEQILQAFALRKDREVAPLQHTRFFAQVCKQAKVLEAIFCEMEECPTTRNTIEFTTLYVRFHSTLAAVGPHQSVVEQACEFIRNHESQHPLTEKRKARVLAEHRQLLDAIQTGDEVGASDAMICHLANSERRWLPEFHDSLSEGNVGFFHKMKEVSFLCVSTINVLPIESEEAEWLTLGLAAADAVARGAALIYLCPTPEITQRLLRDSGDSTPWQNELKVDFEDFIEKITGHIQSVSPRRFISDDEALAYVRSRVFLLILSDDAIFVRTQLDRTCGYFWFQPGSELLTERKPLLRDVAHRKIESIDDRHNLASYKDYLTESLAMARTRLQPNEESALPMLDYVLSCLGVVRYSELESEHE